jgi:uncharacterized protein YdiU (UPF0061 family)
MQSSGIPFDNSYALMPARFFSHRLPTSVEKPTLIRINHALARQLRIDAGWLNSDDAVLAFAGNQIPAGATPIATVYAGHQFGGWNPQLGDGRAILLGEVIGIDGQRYDIQLKGAGETPYSRSGDGRSPLGPVLREYIVSEAMAALGVPTTRSLAAVASGEPVFREATLAGAVLTRVASSHIRIGTFQFFAAREDLEAVQQLADHVIARHYPAAAQQQRPYLALLEMVIARQAKLIATWQQLGFIHGVMNTDNMLLSGETIDYGPCAFMEAHNPATVFSSIDRGGRYAYQNQPPIAQWNLMWLAQALAPLIDADESRAVELAREALGRFVDLYREHYEGGMLAKIGLQQRNEENIALLNELLELMTQSAADHTLTFRRLSEIVSDALPESARVGARYTLPEALAPWITQWRARITEEKSDTAHLQQMMLAKNPVFIARNHLVEQAIQAGYDGDFRPFNQLVDVLASPFTFKPELARYAMPAQPEETVTKTFCGT